MSAFQKMMGTEPDQNGKPVPSEDLPNSSTSPEATGADHFADFDTGEESGMGGDTPEPGGADIPDGVMSPEELAGLATVFGELIGMVSGVVCARFDVETLSPDELNGLATCSANVAQFYVASPSPQQAAWIGLGLVSVSVAAPRYRAVQVRKAAASDVVRKTEAVEAEPEIETD